MRTPHRSTLRRRVCFAKLSGILCGLAAGAAPAHAQSIGVNVGSAPSIVAARGDKITVPIIIDLSNAGASGIAVLESSLAWRSEGLVFDSIRVAPAGWSLTAATEAIDGKLDFGASSTTVLSTTATLLNAYFTVGGAPGGTRIRALPTWSTDAQGQAIQDLLRTRGLDVCVAGAGRWGDVNDDAAVNIIDAQQIARYSVGLSVFDPSVMSGRGDVTANNSVDIIDAQQIARFSVGLSFPARTNTIPFTVPTTGSIELSHASGQHMVEQTMLELTATPRDTSGADRTGCASVTWTSSNPSVATVSGDGVVVGIAGGSATITARSVGNPTVFNAITVIVDPETPPTLAISTDTVRFSAFKEGANPPLQRVVFGNMGSGDLGTVSIGSITYEGGSGWLPTPTLGVFQGQNVVVLQPVTAGMGADQVTARVELLAKDAKDSPQVIVVVFDVRLKPVGSSIEVASGNAQTGPVDTEIATLPRVLVRDQYGEPFAGASVRFFMSAGGGYVHAGATPDDSLWVITNGSGIAQLPGWRFGKTAGANAVHARIDNAASVTINGVATPQAPASMRKDVGDGQSATVGNAVARAPQLIVVDRFGNGVPGVTVTFTATGGGGSVTGPTQVTSANGTASVGAWVMGSSAGSNTLAATLTGIPPLIFNATATLAPATQMINMGGDGQTQRVGLLVATLPRVRVLNAVGNAVAGVTVVFSVLEGGGTLTGAAATTDVNGYASPTGWRMGTRVGRQSIIADAPGLPSVVFLDMATPGVPYLVLRYSGTALYATAGTAVPEPPKVRLTDEYYNPIPGTGVSFVITGGGGFVGSATTNTVLTDDNGYASTSWTLGPGAGAYAIEARVFGASSAYFTATAILTIEIVSGTYQSAATGGLVLNMPTVRVRGAYGAPLFYHDVTWTVTQGGGYWGYKNFAAKTDQNGLASVLWWLGPNLGDQVLTASVPGVPPVTFTATAKNPCVEANYQRISVTELSYSGSIGAADCHQSLGILSGVFDGYVFTLTTMSTVSFSVDPTGFTALADLRRSYDLARSMTIDPSVSTLMPPGTYYYRLGGSGAKAAGSYNIFPKVDSSNDVHGCTDQPFIVPAIYTTQSLDAGDCTMKGEFLFYPDRYYDGFRVYMFTGKTYKFTQRSSKFDAYLELYDGAGKGIISNDDSGGGTDALLTYTPSATGVYVIRASSWKGEKMGAYSLDVTVK